jgi:PAS domain S-box-containing protein
VQEDHRGDYFRQLIELSSDIITLLSAEGLILYESPSAERILGFSPDDLVGQLAFDYVHPDDRAGVLEVFGRLLGTSGFSMPVNFRFRRADGTWLHLEAIGNNRLNDPRVEGIIVSSRDVTERWQMEQALRATEARYRSIFENAVEGIALSARDRSLIDVNPAFAHMLGYESPADLLQSSATADRLYADSGQRDEVRRRLDAHGGLQGFEVLARRKDGSTVWLLIDGRPVFDDAGQFKYFVGFVQDIAERKRVADELQTVQQRLYSVITQAPLILFSMDRQGTFTLSEGAGLANLGLQPGQVVGQSVFDLYADQPNVASVVRRALEGESVRTIITERGLAFDAWYNPVQTADGAIVGVSGVAIDITERVQAEEALSQSKREIFGILESISDGFFTLDTEWRYAYLNSQAGRLVKRQSEDLIGRNIWEAFPEEVDSNLYRVYHDVMRTGSARHFEHFVARLGAWFQISVYRFPAGISVYFSDVSARRQLEDDLRQAQKIEAIGRLAGGIAHDFNNLLTVVSGCTDYLLRGIPTSDPLHRRAEDIKKAADRAAALTHQLLAFSRRQVLNPQLIDFGAVVANIEQLLRRLIGEHIDLVITYSSDLTAVSADRGQIEQVIMNLAVNARDAMPDGGTLSIETDNIVLTQTHVERWPWILPGQYVRLAIRDTGSGMSPEQLAHMFEPFFTTKEAGKGTGLGLSMVYGIVKQSRGYIIVDSEPGRGSTFEIFLPRVEGEALALGEEHGAADEATPVGSETVLLAEDDEAVRTLLSEMLIESGYTVIEACDGEDALARVLARTGAIDVLVSDVVMPRMSGPKLAREVRAILPDIKVLFLSGYTDAELPEDGTLGPRTAFLQKPVSVTTLIRKLKDVLDA